MSHKKNQRRNLNANPAFNCNKEAHISYVTYDMLDRATFS